MPPARIVNIEILQDERLIFKIIIAAGSKEVNSSSESLTMTLF